MKKFNSQEHQSEVNKLNRLWSALHDLEAMATEYGIPDLFQDNGAKILQQLVLLNFDNLAGREGNDAVSASGTEWEMKSINKGGEVITKSTLLSSNCLIRSKLSPHKASPNEVL